ncbi:hypothetical protein GJ496_003950, partial [Pomphorhynchus laevis]
YKGNVGILEHSLDQREKMFTLEAKYEQYYMNIVQAVSENQVDRMEYLFCSFWRDNSSSVESAKLLDQFCRSDKGIAIVCHFDNIMYSAILKLIYPDITKPCNPIRSRIVKSIVDNLQYWLQTALISTSTKLRSIKSLRITNNALSKFNNSNNQFDIDCVEKTTVQYHPQPAVNNKRLSIIAIALKNTDMCIERHKEFCIIRYSMKLPGHPKQRITGMKSRPIHFAIFMNTMLNSSSLRITNSALSKFNKSNNQFDIDCVEKNTAQYHPQSVSLFIRKICILSSHLPKTTINKMLSIIAIALKNTDMCIERHKEFCIVRNSIKLPAHPKLKITGITIRSIHKAVLKIAILNLSVQCLTISMNFSYFNKQKLTADNNSIIANEICQTNNSEIETKVEPDHLFIGIYMIKCNINGDDPCKFMFFYNKRQINKNVPINFDKNYYIYPSVRSEQHIIVFCKCDEYILPACVLFKLWCTTNGFALLKVESYEICYYNRNSDVSILNN